MPVRIQRKRMKGWKAPEGAVYVGRPTKWGNPFSIEMYGRDLALRNYRRHMEGLGQIGALQLSAIRGKDLMCFCPLDQPCHADVLLEIANAEAE
jgi:hypothetical protein